MRTTFLSLVILANFLIATYAPPSFGANLTRFTTETAAQQHCPKDEVVWLNTNSGIWHSQSGR
jgi:hypothetical protein